MLTTGIARMVRNALARGQGEFSYAEFERACATVKVSSLTPKDLNDLIGEGRRSFSMRDGCVLCYSPDGKLPIPLSEFEPPAGRQTGAG